MDFNQPGTATGDKIEFKALLGRLLMIYPKELKPEIQTTMGVKEVLISDVVILDGPNPGEELFDAFIFPGVLIGQLKQYVGHPNPALGRLAYGEGKPGQNPPYKLADFTDADEQTARAWLAQHPRNTFNKPAQQSRDTGITADAAARQYSSQPQQNDNYSGGGYRDYSAPPPAQHAQPPAANVNTSTGEVGGLNIATIRTLIGLNIPDQSIADNTGATLEQIAAIRNLPVT